MTNTGSKQLQVNRCSVDSITLYEVTEYELELLGQGSPSSTLLNFAIFSISLGLAFLTTLLTVEIKDGRTFTVFVVLTVIGILAAAVLFVLWSRLAKSTAGIIAKIKARAIMTTSSTDELATTEVLQSASSESDPTQAG